MRWQHGRPHAGVVRGTPFSANTVGERAGRFGGTSVPGHEMHITASLDWTTFSGAEDLAAVRRLAES